MSGVLNCKNLIEIIDNYEYGLKLMYKLNKNALQLHSEVEERGRGQRLKLKTKRSLEQQYSSCSDEDEIVKEKPIEYPMLPNKKQKCKLNVL